MKAMILAAGRGTRLRPLTDERPKALVEVAGRTMLEITLSRLRAEGVREVIVNVHHFAGMIVDYLKANGNFGMHVEISREEIPLDTGGGLKQAAYFLGGPDGKPFLLHNVDVISTFDLAQMVKFHMERGVLATLAVQQRETSRVLLFDEQNRLCGRRIRHGASDPVETGDEIIRNAAQVKALAFSGIHILSPRIFSKLTEDGVFSIIASYLRLSAEGETVLAFRDDTAYWRDLGKPESVSLAARDIQDGVFSAGHSGKEMP